METQYVRKLQKMGNGLGLRIPPELCQEAEVGKGDNVSLAFNPETGGMKLGKVALTNPGLDNVPAEPNSDNKNESGVVLNAELRVDGDDKRTQNPQTNNSNMKFCPCCGGNEIDVTGNQILCHKCDASFESLAQGGFRLVKMSPLAGEIDDIEQRLGQVEQDVQEIDEQLNPEPDKDDDEGDFLDDEHSKPWGFIGELVEAVFGTGSDEDKDGDEDDLI